MDLINIELSANFNVKETKQTHNNHCAQAAGTQNFFKNPLLMNMRVNYC